MVIPHRFAVREIVACGDFANAILAALDRIKTGLHLSAGGGMRAASAAAVGRGRFPGAGGPSSGRGRFFGRAGIAGDTGE